MFALRLWSSHLHTASPRISDITYPSKASPSKRASKRPHRRIGSTKRWVGSLVGSIQISYHHLSRFSCPHWNRQATPSGHESRVAKGGRCLKIELLRVQIQLKGKVLFWPYSLSAQQHHCFDSRRNQRPTTTRCQTMLATLRPLT